MKNKVSIIFLIAVGLLVVLAFATSKFQTGFDKVDKFGFPFVFFTADNSGELAENTSFRIEFLAANFAIFLAIGYAIVTLFGMLKVEKQTTNKSINNLAHH